MVHISKTESSYSKKFQASLIIVMNICDKTDGGANIADMGSTNLDPNSVIKNRK